MNVGRQASDGVELLDGKLYFMGGWDGAEMNMAERYDPKADQWTTLPSMSTARNASATAVLNGKIYVIGGKPSITSVEIYDPQNEQWSNGTPLPFVVSHAQALSVNGKILLIAGKNASNQDTNKVLEFDPVTSQWTEKATMSFSRAGHTAILIKDKIWVFGGWAPSPNTLTQVEIYDVANDSWTVPPTLLVGDGQLHGMGMDAFIWPVVAMVILRTLVRSRCMTK